MELTGNKLLYLQVISSSNKLLYLGYAYVKNKDLANGWVSFECERRRNYKGCTGRIKANGQQVVVVTNHTLTKSCSERSVKNRRRNEREGTKLYSRAASANYW